MGDEYSTPPQLPLDLLFSDSDPEEDGVRQIHITDSGSHSQIARVDIQGVPADGIIDTAADITIMGGKLFALVAATARLRKKNFRKPDKIPRNYDRRVFHLDGCMDMDIAFQDKTLNTTVYIKMDASDQLLLSEGVCRQLGLVSYHPATTAQKAGKQTQATLVPSIRVSLVQSVKLLPNKSLTVPVRLDPSVAESHQTVMIEGERSFEKAGLITENALINYPHDGLTSLVINNMSGFTQRVTEGTIVGEAQAAEVLVPEPLPNESQPTDVRRLSSCQGEERRKKLLDVLQLQNVPASDAEQLRTFLANNHDVFSLEEGERGETSLVKMEIDTGGEPPQKQPPRRMPFMVREEVGRQLRSMQRDEVIQPSNSPWSSPVVMVGKKDGSHHICVDYRKLNAVTKADTFPLPRIDDLLDQLGGCRYFSSLDLASGFWQIQMDPTLLLYKTISFTSVKSSTD